MQPSLPESYAISGRYVKGYELQAAVALCGSQMHLDENNFKVLTRARNPDI
jgi:hypothetical protein